MTNRLTLTAPLSGLEPLTEYELVPLDDAAGVYSLRSVERPEIRLFVLDAALHLPEFQPELPEASAGGRVFVVVTPRAGSTTVNLLAPIVLDLDAATGAQVMLADDISRVRTPLNALAQ
jgi:flagellar assembly factor FliW